MRPVMALGRPTSLSLKRICLLRLVTSTVSLSIKMIFLTPSLANPIATPLPSPPTPRTKQTDSSTLVWFQFCILIYLSNTPISGKFYESFHICTFLAYSASSSGVGSITGTVSLTSSCSCFCSWFWTFLSSSDGY